YPCEDQDAEPQPEGQPAWPRQTRPELAAVEPPDVNDREGELQDLAGADAELQGEVVAARLPGEDHEIYPRQNAGKQHGEGQRPALEVRRTKDQGRRGSSLVLGPWSLVLGTCHPAVSTTRRTSTRSFFSAAFAVAMMSASTAGSSASGRHRSVMT